MPAVTDDNRVSSGEMSPTICPNYKRRRGNNKSPALPFHEAPARLSGSPLRIYHRQRGQSLSICEENSRNEAFVALEQNSSLWLADLPQLCVRANLGLKWDVEPILAEGATGGTYFLRDRNRMMVCVLKPGDEELNSPHNPHQGGLRGPCAKGNITPGKARFFIFFISLFLV